MERPDRSTDAAAVGRRVLAQEARALDSLAQSLGSDFDRAVELLLEAQGRIVVTGVGKSGHVGRKVAATFASTGSPAFFMHAGEASHGDLGMVSQGDVILALSKSGEVREFKDVLGYAARFAIPLVAITAAPDSPLGRAATLVLRLPTTDEATAEVNAPTISTTMQIALGDALAVALLERRGFSAASFKIYHPGGKLGAQLRTVGELMHGREALPLIETEAPMTEALLVMTERRFGCVGVRRSGGPLLGLITDGDLRRHMTGLLDQTAGQVMTPHPLTVTPDALAAEALKLMEDRRITVLFVVEDGLPIGILHIHDLLRAGLV
ncbi:MAG: KpsF/GutQ family sugar-phosphate isomerase [Caulobacterales bacterium 32-69-10]|nr:MAG: KpsF/GutQ family sugar-phosphate isomerase [Caulobacterales bacterium 32-69-10]